MGFKNKGKKFKLVFPEDHDLHGLEIVIRGITLGAWKSLIEDESLSRADRRNKETEYFVKQVDSWNLEDDDDSPMAVTVENFESLDLEYVGEIKKTWLNRCLGIDLDEELGKESAGGSNTGNTPGSEDSLPMESL